MFAALAGVFLSVSCGLVDPVSPELYMDRFDLEPSTNWQGEVADVKALNPISAREIMDVMVGNGWEGVSIYRLDMDKNLVETVENSVPTCFMVKNEDTHIQYGLNEKSYEVLPFDYDEDDNSISLSACWYTGYEGAKVVHVTDDTLVCVSSRGANYKGEPMIFMIIFQKVTKKTLKDWQETCPYEGLWV